MSFVFRIVLGRKPKVRFLQKSSECRHPLGWSMLDALLIIGRRWRRREHNSSCGCSDNYRREGIPVESPMPVSHGSQYAHRIVADTRQDDPLVRDAQPHQVVMKVAVTVKGLVSVPDDQAQTRTPGKGGSVLLRITARADREEARLLAAINVSKEAFGLDSAGAWRPVQRLLHRSGAHH